MDVLTITDLLITNGVLGWVGLRLVKRVDQLDQRLDTYETRISVAEKEIEYATKN